MFKTIRSLLLALKRGNRGVKTEISHSLSQIGLLYSIYILFKVQLKEKQFGPLLQVRVALNMIKWRMSRVFQCDIKRPVVWDLEHHPYYFLVRF